MTTPNWCGSVKRMHLLIRLPKNLSLYSYCTICVNLYDCGLTFDDILQLPVDVLVYD